MDNNELWIDFLNAEPQTETKIGLKKLDLEVIQIDREANHYYGENDTKTIDIQFKDKNIEKYGRMLRVNKNKKSNEDFDVAYLDDLDFSSVDKVELGKTIREFSNYKYIKGVSDLKKVIKSGQTNFKGYTILNINSRGLSLEGLDFSGARFEKLSLGGAKINNCNFDNTIFIHSGLGHSTIVNSSFENAKLIVDLRDCELNDVSFNNSDLRNFNTYNTTLTNVKMKDVKKNRNFDIKDIERLMLMNEAYFETKIVTIDNDNPIYQMLEFKYADVSLPDNRYIAYKDKDNFIIKTIEDKPKFIKKGDLSIDDENDLYTVIQEQFDSTNPNNIKEEMNNLGIKLVKSEYSNGVLITTVALTKNDKKQFKILTSYKNEDINNHYRKDIKLNTIIHNKPVYDEFIKNQYTNDTQKLKNIDRDLKLLSVTIFQKHREEIINKSKLKEKNDIEVKPVLNKKKRNRLT